MSSHTNTVELWDAGQAQKYADEVFAVYAAVFADQQDRDTWRADVYDKHCARDGFRLAVVQEESELVGFAWGYLGEPGRFWSDWVRRELPADVASDWVGGHFEFVELAVLTEHRRHGYGRRLHDVLLDGVPSDRAMLSTDNHDSPAVRLYTGHGWTKLGELSPDVQVMGLRLAKASFSHSGRPR